MAITVLTNANLVSQLVAKTNELVLEMNLPKMVANSTANGAMSSADKVLLDGQVSGVFIAATYTANTLVFATFAQNTVTMAAITARMQVANVNTLDAAKVLLINDRMQVANAIALHAVSDSAILARMQVANVTLLVNDRMQVANADAKYLDEASNLSDVASVLTAFDNIKQNATTSVTGVVELAANTEFANNTTGKALTTDGVWSSLTEQSLTSGAGVVAWDMWGGIDFKIDTLSQNTVIQNPSHLIPGKKGRVRVVQDAGGNNTVGWASWFRFGGGGTAPVATVTGNAEDYFYYDTVSANAILISAVLDVS